MGITPLYFLGILLIWGGMLILYGDLTRYLLPKPIRATTPSLPTTDFLFAIWLFLIAYIFIPDLARLVSPLPEPLNARVSLTVTQILLIVVLWILFRTILRTWQIPERPEPKLLRNLPIIVCFWYVPAFLLFVLVQVVWVYLLTKYEIPYQRQEALIESMTTQDPFLLIPLFFSVVIAAPIWEEFLFRGLLFRFLQDRTGFWFAAIVSGLLFSFMHGLVMGLPGLWLLGIVLAMAYRSTGCIWVPIGIHALHNLNTLLLARFSMNYPNSELALLDLFR